VSNQQGLCGSLGDSGNLGWQAFMSLCQSCDIDNSWCNSIWQSSCARSNCSNPDCKEKADIACPLTAGQPEDPFKATDITSAGFDLKNLDLSTTTKTKGTATTKSATGGKPASGSDTSKASAATGTPSAASTGNASADLQQCQSLQQSAYSYCPNPTVSTNTNNQVNANQGMNGDFSQMQQAAAQNAQANLQASGECYRRYTNCANICNSLANNYSDSTATNLRSMASSCQRLSQQSSAMGAQSLQSSNASALSSLGQALSGMAGAEPSQTSDDPYGCAQDPQSAACVQCGQNPSAPSCQALAQANQTEQGKAGFKTADDLKATDFNVPSPSSDSLAEAREQALAQAAAGQVAKPPEVKPVANNSGGGVGGSSDSPAQGASLGDGGQGSPGSPGYNTQVNQGFRSASGGGSGFSSSSVADNSDMNYGRYAGRRPASQTSPGLDLKQYLPGGLKDPSFHRGVAGMGGSGTSAGAHIHGRFVNLWNRISDKMQEKCRLGELFDCR
jgi:hypothetical protein